MTVTDHIITSNTRQPPCGCTVAWTATNRNAGWKRHRCDITAVTYLGRLIPHDYRGTRFLTVEWKPEQ